MDMTEEEIKIKFRELVERQGLKSIHHFSKVCGLDNPNVYANLQMKNRPSIRRMFTYADTLGVSIHEILELFYSEECQLNTEAIKNHNKITGQYTFKEVYNG